MEISRKKNGNVRDFEECANPLNQGTGKVTKKSHNCNNAVKNSSITVIPKAAALLESQKVCQSCSICLNSEAP